MRFSIVVPTYNEEHDIAKTLDSLVVLDWPDFEIIVIDDSTDSTPRIVRSYADKGVRLIRPEVREGRCGARNLGIMAATGEVVVVLNADTHLPVDFFQRIEPHYAAGADYVLVRSVVENMDDLFARYVESSGIALFYGQDPNLMEWTEGFSCRREMAIRAGLFPTGFAVPICAGEDGFFGENLRKLGARKKVDLDIVVTHVAPAPFDEYWAIRKGRGQGSPQVRRFLQKWSFSRIGIRATLRVVKNALMALTLLPMLWVCFRYARASPRGTSDTLPFCWAWLIEQAAFSVGEWQSLKRIYLAEHALGLTFGQHEPAFMEFPDASERLAAARTFMSDLPVGDHTPPGYSLPVPGRFEPVKRLVRAYLYPLYNLWNHRWLKSRYGDPRINADLYLWGQRGNDYERQRRRVARFIPIQSARILVAGCGTGRDVESWVRLGPKSITGLDLFSYRRAWDMWQTRFASVAPGVEASFAQGNLEDLRQFPDASFDLISSDAVFEHVRDIPKVLAQFHRILKPGGVLYATFGPLWYGWGGDHVSGYDSVLSGFNHLTLVGEAYRRYLDGLGAQAHSEHDGRTWIDNDLFSRLKPAQYLQYLDEEGFKRLFVAEIIDPSAVACLEHPDFDRSPLHGVDEHDLLASGMTIIYRC